MEFQNENSRQNPYNPQGNIWGWKFSAFSFILIAVVAYVAFVIGEGPGAVKQPLPADSATITNAKALPDTASDTSGGNARLLKTNR